MQSHCIESLGNVLFSGMLYTCPDIPYCLGILYEVMHRDRNARKDAIGSANIPATMRFSGTELSPKKSICHENKRN